MQRGKAELRELAALDEAKRASEALDIARADAGTAATEQRRVAEAQLQRLLAAQRRELEAKMEQMGHEHEMSIDAIKRLHRSTRGMAMPEARASARPAGPLARCAEPLTLPLLSSHSA